MIYLSKDEINDIKRSNNLSLMKKYCDEDKSNSKIHLVYAQMLTFNGKIPEAKEELKSLLTTKYECAARFELGKIALNSNNYNLARDHFHYVEDNTNFQYEREKARLEIAKLELECKELEESKRYFEKLLGTYYDENAKLNLGRICYKLEDYEKSKEYLKQLLSTTYNYTASYDLARTEYALGNIDLARYYYKTSAEHGNSYSVFELGKLEYNEGNYKEAEICFENCKYPTIYLPKTKYLLGKKDEAIAEYESLLNTRDDYQSRLQLSMIYIKDKKYEEAFDIIKNVMSPYNSVDTDTKLKISLILSKELGIFFYKNYPKFEELSYSDKQSIMYDETSALTHITINHTSHLNKNNFNDKVDLFGLFNSIKEELTDENNTPSLTFNDVYHVDYPNIGSNGENILRIVTLPGTKDIITMFPVTTRRDNLDNTEEENMDYGVKVNMLLKKLSNLYELSQNNNFDLSDVFSDLEKDLLSEMFDLKSNKTKALKK